MPHRQDSSGVQPKPPSSRQEYVFAVLLAATIVVPTWIVIWWLLP